MKIFVLLKQYSTILKDLNQLVDKLIGLLLLYFFLCDLDGHIEDLKVQKSLEELGLHCQDFHVLGVFEADKLREK